MPSETSDGCTRPKSPLAEQPPSATKTRRATVCVAGWLRRQRSRGGIVRAASAAPHPAAAAILRRWIAVRGGLFDLRVDIPLNPDHRQDDDRCRFGRRFAAEAHDAPLFREFDDVIHQPLPLPLARGG